MPDLIALPVRHKGLRLRRFDDFVDAEVSMGSWDMAPRSLIDLIDDEGTRHGGLYPSLESALGEIFLD